MPGSAEADVLGRVPRVDSFGLLIDPRSYRPLPDDWMLGLSDVVNSTEAIRSGRYKAVNMAGAAVVAAVTNALGHQDFAFVFGGDGASLAVAASSWPATRDALAATATFVQEEYGLALRVGGVPVSAVRQAGYDARVARFAVSPHLAYALFSGGGVAWAQDEMKAARYAIPPASPGSRPDLSGLSCRFDQIATRRGLILSLIVRPVEGRDLEFRELIGDILGLVEASPGRGKPVPDEGPRLAWPPKGLDLELRTRSAGGASGRPWRRLRLLGRIVGSILVMRAGIRLGSFDPKRYIGELVANSDYRKFDDGLSMTLDCGPDLADAIETRLASAEAAGAVRYGMHRQDAALMTCITTSVHRPDHVHFVDGASGGYAAAASALKATAAPSVRSAPA